jgi:hypothetical protein
MFYDASPKMSLSGWKSRSGQRNPGSWSLDAGPWISDPAFSIEPILIQYPGTSIQDRHFLDEDLIKSKNQIKSSKQYKG